MTKLKLIFYLLVVNILPYLLYDLIYRYVQGTLLEFLDAHFILNIIVFILVYIFVQMMLFRFILKNLYDKKLVSSYVGE